MFKKIIMLASVLVLTACDKTTDLSDQNNVAQLIERGWLPAFFRQKTIVEGQEIHRGDDNSIWGYIIPNDLALEKDCLQVKQSIPYQKPPRAMRQYWVSKEKYQQQKQYICPKISDSLHFFSIENKLFFYQN